MQKLLLFVPVLALAVLVGCGEKAAPVQTSTTPETYLAPASEVTPSASTDYVKPEGWVTYQSAEYGFRLDVPSDWYFNSESSQYSYGRGGVNIGSLKGSTLLFAVHKEKNGQKIPRSQAMPELTDNDALVAKGGDAFKYFRNVYSQNVENDDLIYYYPVGTSADSVSIQDLVTENFIRINIDPEKVQNPEEHLDTMKTIIKSFRR